MRQLVPIVERPCSTGRVSPIANHYEPVHIAIEHNCLNLLRYMMEQSANGTYMFIRQGSLMPIHHAMRFGCLESLVVLMERDQVSHAMMTESLLRGLQIDVTKLPPEAVRAAVAGDLEALKANIPNGFNSTHEIDVLLGLARHHPDVLAYLKELQQDFLAAYVLPILPHILDVVESERTLITLLKNFEAKEAYGFLVRRQLMALARILGSIKPRSHRLNAEGLARPFGGRLPGGFKNIDR